MRTADKKANDIKEKAVIVAEKLQNKATSNAKKLLEYAKGTAQEIVRETAMAVSNATKSENSGLIGEIKREVVGLKDHLTKQDEKNNILQTSVTVLETHHLEIKETLARIESQTVKTNGRVGIIEIWKANRNGWIAGFGVMIFIVMGLLTYIFNNSIAVINTNITRIEKTK